MRIYCNSQGTQSRDPSVIKHNGKYYWTYAADNKIYVMSESACNKYIFGKFTSGFNVYAYKYDK